MELSDRELLDRFATRQDDAAFRALVERHLALVHGVARRVTGNEALAQDVAQACFLRLAHRAALIPKDLWLTAWLHRVTHHLAIDLVRREERRKKRELATQDPALMDSTPSPNWSELAPVIDTLINRLPAADRELLLLRFYRNETHAAVARKLGLTEAAAKKRATRALEKLRGLLAKKGIATSAAALATLLPAHAATPVAGSYVLAVSTTVKGAAPVAASSFNIHLAMTTAQKSSIAVAALIFMASAGYALRSSSPEGPAALSSSQASSGETGGNAATRTRAEKRSPLSAAERLEKLRLILAHPSVVERQRQMLAFIDELGTSQYTETANQLEQLGTPAYHPQFKMLIGAWVKAHPMGAVTWAKGHPSKEMLPEVLTPWGEADPAASLDWVVREVPGATGGDQDARAALISVLAGTATRDLPAAVKGLDVVPLEQDRANATKHLANQLSQLRPGMTELMLEILKPAGGAQYNELLVMNLQSFINAGNAEGALQVLLENEGARKVMPIKNFYRQYYLRPNPEAVEAISRIPAGSLQDEAVQGYCVATVNTNPPETYALLDRYPGAVSDMVLAEMGQGVSIEHVGLGLERMLQIKDPALRDESMTQRLKWWLQRNEADARKWMEAHDLSLEVRDALKGPIEPLQSR